MKTERHRLSKEAIGNKRRYDADYLSKYYTHFSVHIPKEEVKKYDELLKSKKMTRVKFLRLAFKLLENDELSKKDV